ncbi:hypothetical protein AA309_20250 [Microvirga vignae]|uniref:Uncharacterized protein n=1 Tax=Microvirga vignae TaxID=1225564 RepID=A0A0H1R8C9_9HYPH|nr:hypothetical protein [Microvirga vignae]KLK91428.1 hypothetical protein AA309_20250 [Microvirga vignae]
MASGYFGRDIPSSSSGLVSIGKAGGGTSGAGAASLEQAVRPFVVIDSAPRAERPKRPALPGEDTEAFLAWGQASTWVQAAPTDPIAVDPDRVTVGGISTTDSAIKGLELVDPPDEDLTQIWEEESREVEEVRVENPDDKGQYVVTKRVVAIKFRSAVGFRFMELRFKNG